MNRLPDPETTSITRRRSVVALATVVVVTAGLLTRCAPDHLPRFMTEYAGDALWALMVFLGLGLLLPQARTITLAWSALAFSWCVELSQLYRAPWIEQLRHTTLGGLVLGFGFRFSDLVAYGVGVGVGVLLDRALRRRPR